MGNNISLEVIKQPRIQFYTLIFLIDVYDTYLHEYPPLPEPDDIHEVVEKGAFAKYESAFGRFCWMALSYVALFLLFKKNILKARNLEKLSKYEMLCIGLAIGGFLLRVWCKRLLGRHFTYQITVYKDHQIIDEGPYSIIRHPGMSGMLMNWAGICAWLNHWWGYALYALLLRDTYCHTLSEEKEFRKNLPSYSQYMTRVRSRFIPFIW